MTDSSVFWGSSIYVCGGVVLSHSCVDIFAIVLIASYGESYPSKCFAALLKTDDILHMGTQCPIYIDYGDNMEEVKVHYQHMDLYQGLNDVEKIKILD